MAWEMTGRLLKMACLLGQGAAGWPHLTLSVLACQPRETGLDVVPVAYTKGKP